MSVLVLTDRTQARVPLAEIAAAVAAAGARYLVLREKDQPRDKRLALAEILRSKVARLVVAGPDPLGGDAVHLAAADGPATAGLAVVGRSCHSPYEVDIAHDATYLTVSPVFASRSKPGYGPGLGIDGLARLVALTNKPVYALGGIETPERAAMCVAAGAAGVAVMGGAMRAEDPYEFVRAMVAAVAR